MQVSCYYIFQQALKGLTIMIDCHIDIFSYPIEIVCQRCSSRTEEASKLEAHLS